MTTPTVTDRDVQQYQSAGYIKFDRLYDPETMLAWKSRLQKQIARDDGADGSGVRVWMSDVIDPVLRDGVCDLRIAGIVRQLYDDDVEFLSAKAVFKNAGVDYGSPWHHDYMYWGGSNKLSAWIALDDATPDNGCLKVIPGSHTMTFTQTSTDRGPGFIHRIEQEDVADLPGETVPVNRGDVIFFSDRTVHSSHPNQTGEDRWSFISTYRSACVPDSSDVWETSVRL